MKLGHPELDLRGFRFSRLWQPGYRHLKLLLYWPAFGAAFFAVERLWIREDYFPISCTLDSAIPFCELFVLPYLFWFIFLAGIHLYAMLYDTASFRKLMKFIAISYSIALVIYIVFPNCQELRPAVFPRDNVLTRFMAGFYQFDTNTNVCPSLHVIGSAAVLSCAWHSKHFSTLGWRAAFTVTALLISVSTVFLKQHSLVDVLVALPLCGLAYYWSYGVKETGSSRSSAPARREDRWRKGAGPSWNAEPNKI